MSKFANALISPLGAAVGLFKKPKIPAPVAAPTRDDVARGERPRHPEIIGEDEPVEAQPPAQDLLQPDAREARGQRIHRGIDHVRRHHRFHARAADDDAALPPTPTPTNHQGDR